MKLVQYLVDWFDAGEKKFVAGMHYAFDEITGSHAEQGLAVVKEVDVDPERAQKLAEKAQAAADKAAASAASAKSDAEAAVAAADLARAAREQIAAGIAQEADDAAATEAATALRVKHAQLLQEKADAAIVRLGAAESASQSEPDDTHVAELLEAAQVEATSLQAQADEAKAAV